VQHGFSPRIKGHAPPLTITGDNDCVRHVRETLHNPFMLRTVRPGEAQRGDARMDRRGLQCHSISCTVKVIKLRHIATHDHAAPTAHWHIIQSVGDAGWVQMQVAANIGVGQAGAEQHRRGMQRPRRDNHDARFDFQADMLTVRCLCRGENAHRFAILDQYPLDVCSHGNSRAAIMGILQICAHRPLL
jgi:hypothetical protein